MNITVLDESLNKVHVVDTYDSVIWTDRYDENGDFELEVANIEDAMLYLKRNRYLSSERHDSVMIIENAELVTDQDEGDILRFTGRSLESILERRVVTSITTLTGNLQTEVERLLNEAIINPTVPERQISNFIFAASADPVITALTIDKQITGDDLYSAISAICKKNNIGFKVVLIDGNFVFSLYSGKDRSRAQSINPVVEFSPQFENLTESSFYEQSEHIYTSAIVAGEGEGVNRKTYLAEESVKSGLSRREVYVDARDISSETESGTLTEAEYNEKLKERGLDVLADNKISRVFDGEIQRSNVFKYGYDYFLGDTVQFKDKYGNAATVRVTEMIFSQDASGIATYPSFGEFET